MKLRQEINLINTTLTASANGFAFVELAKYPDGTFYFEAVGRVASGTMTVTLRRVGTTTDDATLTFTETAYTRKRTAAFTPPSGGQQYFVFISGGTTPQVRAARVLVLQDATEIEATETQIEIGNLETARVNTTSTPLANPKYWKYEASKWENTSFEAEIIWRPNNNMTNYTLSLQEDNGSFGSWTDKVFFINAATGAVAVTRTRVSFTPVDGRHYRIAGFTANNMNSYDIYMAKIVGISDGRIWAQEGNSLSISEVGTPALASLTSTRVAFIDSTNDQLRTYDFDGTNWSQTGNSLSIATVGIPALAGLSSTRVAFIDGTNNQLRTYDFDGTNWSQVGNSLSITSFAFSSLASLSSTRVAFIDSLNDQLRTYDFDGTNWAQVGNSLSITGVGNPALAGLSSTRVAFIDATNQQLRTYDFDGTNWSQVGNSLSISGVGTAALAFLTSTRVAFIDGTNDQLRTYDFDGTNWSQASGSTSIATVAGAALAGLSSTRVAFIDSTNDQLRTYDFELNPVSKVQSQYLLANTGSFGASTGLKDYDTRYDPAEWDEGSGTIAFYHEGNGVAAGTGDLKLQSDPNGTPTDITGSQITDCIEVERSSALTMPGSASDIDVNVTGTGTLNASRIIVDYSFVEGGDEGVLQGSSILSLNTSGDLSEVVGLSGDSAKEIISSGALSASVSISGDSNVSLNTSGNLQAIISISGDSVISLNQDSNLIVHISLNADSIISINSAANLEIDAQLSGDSNISLVSASDLHLTTTLTGESNIQLVSNSNLLGDLALDSNSVISLESEANLLVSTSLQSDSIVSLHSVGELELDAPFAATSNISLNTSGEIGLTASLQAAEAIEILSSGDLVGEAVLNGESAVSLVSLGRIIVDTSIEGDSIISLNSNADLGREISFSGDSVISLISSSNLGGRFAISADSIIELNSAGNASLTVSTEGNSIVSLNASANLRTPSEYSGNAFIAFVHSASLSLGSAIESDVNISLNTSGNIETDLLFSGSSILSLNTSGDIGAGISLESDSIVSLVSSGNAITDSDFVGSSVISLNTLSELGLSVSLESDSVVSLVSLGRIIVDDNIEGSSIISLNSSANLGGRVQFQGESTIVIVQNSDLTIESGEEVSLAGSVSISLNSESEASLDVSLNGDSSIIIDVEIDLAVITGLSGGSTIDINTNGNLQAPNYQGNPVLVLDTSGSLTINRALPPYARIEPICCDVYKHLGCLVGCDDFELPIVSDFTGDLMFRYLFNGQTHLRIIQVVEGQKIVLPDVFNELEPAFFELVKPNGLNVSYMGHKCFVIEVIKYIRKTSKRARLSGESSIVLISDADINLFAMLQSNTNIQLITQGETELFDSSLQSNVNIQLITEAETELFDSSLQANVNIQLIVEGNIETCPEVELDVTYSDECTYFITGEHPNTGDPDSRLIILDTSTPFITFECRFRYFNCLGEIENVVLSPNVGNIRVKYAGTTISAGGYTVHMKVRVYDPILDSESVITIPMAPGTAELTGCAGTVSAADLTYDGTNSLAFRTAQRLVVINYLCSLGYVDGVNFLVQLNTNLSGTPLFYSKHTQGGADTWIGIRTITETISDAIRYTTNGVDFFDSAAVNVSTVSPTSTMSRTSPCGIVTRTIGYTFQNRSQTNSWRDFTNITSEISATQTDQQQTCPINLYDFEPPECEGAEWFWQYSFDGIDPYITVQIGGTQFEPEEQGFYRILYICNGCEYIYEFTYFIF